jgi:hypothetical protein
MNCCRETAKTGVSPGNRPAVPRDWSRTVPERYVAGADTRGHQEGRPHPRSQQVIHETPGLDLFISGHFSPAYCLQPTAHFLNRNGPCHGKYHNLPRPASF